MDTNQKWAGYYRNVGDATRKSVDDRLGEEPTAHDRRDVQERENFAQGGPPNPPLRDSEREDHAV